LCAPLGVEKVRYDNHKVLTPYEVVASLRNEWPVIAGFANPESRTDTEGHDVIIYGCRIDNGALKFKVYNPLPQNVGSNNVGSSFECTYNELAKGTTGKEGCLSRPWTDTIRRIAK
jgi:hypothetical protein